MQRPIEVCCRHRFSCITSAVSRQVFFVSDRLRAVVTSCVFVTFLTFAINVPFLNEFFFLPPFPHFSIFRYRSCTVKIPPKPESPALSVVGREHFRDHGCASSLVNDLMLPRSNCDRKVWRQARLSVCCVRRRL